VLLGSTDEQLVGLVLGGDDDAFEILFDRHVADAVWFARDVLGSWGEAEEAVRHSFAAAHAYLASRDRNIEFGPWLHTILSNHCLSMLQARGRGPATADVVDLERWRRRKRGRLGLALPFAPSAALHDGVMSACGIGAGAATAGSAPLLGGTLAKVAVVALLAGGAGVTGQQLASEPRPPPERAAVAETGVAASGDASPDLGLLAAPLGTRAESRSGQPRRWALVRGRAPGAPRSRAPADPAPDGDAPAHRAEPVAGAPAPASPGQSVPPAVDTPIASRPSIGAGPPAQAVNDVSTTVAAPVRTTLQGVGDAVRSHLPVVGDSTTPPPPTPAPGVLTGIGDDLQVTADKLTSDVRSVLSNGSNAPSQ
jgi:hypothetical protein